MPSAETSSGHEQTVTEETHNSSRLSIEGELFLQELTRKSSSPAEADGFDEVDVARLRLLGTAITSHGNDEVSLEAHDGNILFVHRDIEFGRTELQGLVRSGLSHFKNENLPLWFWFKKLHSAGLDLLPIYSFFFRTESAAIGALQAMRLIRQPLVGEQRLSRAQYRERWLDSRTAASVRMAALEYLGLCGIADDLEAIEVEIDRADSQTLSTAIEAAVRIRSREDRIEAVKSLYHYQPASVTKELVGELFDKVGGIPTEVLLGGLKQKTPDLRRVATRALSARGALTVEIATDLLTDTNAEVRYDAVMTLFKLEEEISDDQVRKHLVKPSRSLGLFSQGGSDSAGEACMHRFEHWKLERMSDRTLEDHADKMHDFMKFDAYHVLVARRFSRYEADLRRSVASGYAEEFSSYMNNLISLTATSKHELIDRAKGLEDFVRAGATFDGLEIICNKGDQSDLALVRDVIARDGMSYSAAQIEYLRKYGEWTDIQLVVDIVERIERRTGIAGLMVGSANGERYRLAARAICKLGKGRETELIGIPLPGRLRSYVISEMSLSAFASIEDVDLLMVMRAAEDVARKAAALKCLLALSRKRVERLLGLYMSPEEQRYYNVIHWLDFGISVERSHVIAAARETLNVICPAG